MIVNVRVNGIEQRVDVGPWRTLLELLREELKLTGTKSYCESGVCGACTVLLDGKAVSSCSVLAPQVDGRAITTIEGMASGPSTSSEPALRDSKGRAELHPIQRAFIEHFGFQCGYCTPGMILLTKALLEENPKPTRDEIVRYLGGNICRCTGYAGIIASVEAAAKAMGNAAESR